MFLKILHVVFALIVLVLIAGTATLGWNGLPMAKLITVVLTTVFFWYATWRNITDVRKEELLEAVEAIDDVDDELNGPLDAQANSRPTVQRTDQIRADLTNIQNRDGSQRAGITENNRD